MGPQHALTLLKSILSEITSPSGGAKTEDFSSLREVDGKIKEVRMIFSGVDCLPSLLVEEMNLDNDFEANSRRVRLESLANYVRSAIKYLDSSEVQGNRMSFQDAQQVCLNGHQITDSYHTDLSARRDYCEECGEKTIHECPHCGSEIRGYLDIPGVVSGFSVAVPTHCADCGKPFPWNDKAGDEVYTAGNIESDHINIIQQICSRFSLIARQLTKRHSSRETLVIKDEYDTQDLLHALLHIYFDDIREEEWSPSYAGGASRVDFLLKEEKIVIEVKKTRDSLKAKELGEQLIIDSVKYRSHPDCKKLFCFVYDPDYIISNPRGIENDLYKKEEDFEVKVLIVPKGH